MTAYRTPALPAVIETVGSGTLERGHECDVPDYHTIARHNIRATDLWTCGVCKAVHIAKRAGNGAVAFFLATSVVKS